MTPILECLSRHQTDELLTTLMQPLDGIGNLITAHPADLQVKPLVLNLLLDQPRQHLGVARTGVDGDLDVLGLEVRQRGGEVVHEGRVKQADGFGGELALLSEFLVLRLLGAVERHGALGEPVADDEVDVAVLGEVSDGSLAIGEAARGTGDADSAFC